MAWTDRIRAAAYTSPSGSRYTFLYDDVHKEFDRKTSSYNFADADGTYVQDLGRTGRRLPMRFIFSGENYDVDANNFELALAESGVAILEHPMYGTINVVPFGSVKRTDRLKSGSNQANIDVVLWETIGVIYPTPQGDAAAAVAEAITDFGSIGADSFKNAMSLGSIVEQALAKNPVAQGLQAFKSGLQKVADAQADTQRALDAVFNSINDSLDTLIGDPLTLAFQTSIMIGTPARSLALITDKLKAYADLARSIFGKKDAVREPSLDTSSENNYNIDYLFATNAVVGMALSSINNQFETKTGALSAADEILTVFNELKDWQDANLESLEVIDTGETYQALQKVVALVSGFLVEISFTLLQEKRIVLDRDRGLVELVGELYGEVDPKLDFFINSNNLTGDEIFELPRGREIVYYQ